MPPSVAASQGAAAITRSDTQPAVNCLPRLTCWICSWGFRPQNSPSSHGWQFLAADESAPGPGHRAAPPVQATPQGLRTAKA